MTSSRNTELLAAVESADDDAILQCLKKGTDANAASENGWTPLMLAVLHGSPATVKLLLEYGADPNLTTQSEENPSRSALAVAIRNGRLEVVQALVDYGANIDARGPDGLVPVELAQKLALRPFHQEKIVAIALFLKEAKADSVGRSIALATG